MKLNSQLLSKILVVSLLAISSALASDDHNSSYEIFITNLTKGQVFSPVYAVTHNNNLNLFVEGEEASSGLAALAQDAKTSILDDMLADKPDVFSIVKGENLIMPGKTETIEIDIRGNFKYLSLVSMLVTMNDGFTGLNKIELNNKLSMITVPAYDAGSEENNESCEYIPGPPCGSHAIPGAEAEGFIHVHSGIHGIGDLSPATLDWRSPVTKIVIKKINGRD